MAEPIVYSYAPISRKFGIGDCLISSFPSGSCRDYSLLMMVQLEHKRTDSRSRIRQWVIFHSLFGLFQSELFLYLNNEALNSQTQLLSRQGIPAPFTTPTNYLGVVFNVGIPTTTGERRWRFRFTVNGPRSEMIMDSDDTTLVLAFFLGLGTLIYASVQAIFFS